MDEKPIGDGWTRFPVQRLSVLSDETGADSSSGGEARDSSIGSGSGFHETPALTSEDELTETFDDADDAALAETFDDVSDDVIEEFFAFAPDEVLEDVITSAVNEPEVVADDTFVMPMDEAFDETASRPGSPDQGGGHSGTLLAARYELLHQIGRGGMGSVYCARDTELDREVAAKIVGEYEDMSPESRARFEREGRALAVLSSPHLPMVYDMGTWQGVGYIIMQFIEAPTLARRLVDQGKFSVSYMVELVCQLLDALHHMHVNGFIHRDVKPSNILIDEHDHLTLVDLGVALQVAAIPLTGRGYAVGTPRFMSPEQRIGRAVDRRSDIYAVGLLMALMLTSAMPQTSWNYYENTVPMEQLGLAEPWLGIIDRCLEEEPDQRWVDCPALKRAILDAARLVQEDA